MASTELNISSNRYLKHPDSAEAEGTRHIVIELSPLIAAGSKAMFYSPDSFGLGHLRRTLTLANHLHANVPNLTQLIVTGSPAANRFRYPQGVDFVKLPSITKDDTGKYVPWSLSDTSMDIIRTMRRDILLSVARHFEPDFFIVDHTPTGLDGEAVGALHHLKQFSPGTRLVMGLRDIVDQAAVVRQWWAKDGVYELFDDLYDRILVYGIRSFYDVVTEYGLSPKAAEKTRFVGYLGREPGTRAPEEVRASLGMQTDKLVVVTGGGGGDGRVLYEAILRDLRIADVCDFDCLIVGGPLLADADWAAIRGRLRNRGDMHFVDFTDDLPSYLGAADAVISMGGYNTVCEILSLKLPAIVVPRVHPREEQLIRAQVLSSHGAIQMLHPNDLAPTRLTTLARQLLAQPPVSCPVLPLDGLANVTRELLSLHEQPHCISSTICA